MEILQLQYFECIAKHESVSKAAEELHVSQPSLSSALIRLETELGAQLFDRHGRHIKLNSYGKFFLSNTRKILNLIKASKLTIGKQDMKGRLRIGFQNFNTTIMEIIDSYAEENPNISFDIHGSTLNRPFSFSSFDFVVGNANVNLPRPMKSLLIEPREYYAVLPAGHRLADREQISILELAREQFCFLRDEQGNFEHSYYSCIDSGFIPHCKYTTNDAFYKLRYMAKGNCVSFIPTGWIPVYTQMGNLKVVPLEGYQGLYSIRLLWTDEIENSYVAQDFLEYVKQKLQK